MEDDKPSDLRVVHEKLETNGTAVKPKIKEEVQAPLTRRFEKFCYLLSAIKTQFVLDIFAFSVKWIF